MTDPRPLDALARPALRIGNMVLARYLAASVVALGLDFCIFMALVRLGTAPASASALGYCAGIVVHWAISSRFVFTGKRRQGSALHAQRILFLASALIGLALTVGTVGLLTALGVIAIAAKAAAAIISFVSVYALRKYGVFR
ncbi:MAG: GtrA family protein [Blastomonas sp.]